MNKDYITNESKSERAWGYTWKGKFVLTRVEGSY